MKDKYTIGLDIGTTSICGVLYRVGDGTVTACESGKNAFLPEERYGQDPERIWAVTEKILENLWTEKIAGIGISSQMHGILYVDGHGEAVSPYFTWKDTRGSETAEHNRTYAGLLSERTGYPLSSGYGTVTHAWMQWNGCIPSHAEKIANIGDYVGMRLTGRRNPLMSPSIGASLGGFDVESGRFARKALEKAGVDCGYLPETADERTVLGAYRGVPVYCACGDSQASFLGAVGGRQDCVSVNVGTGSQVAVHGGRWNLTGGVDVRPYPLGGYLYVGASLNGGKVFELLARFLEEICVEFAGVRPDLADVYRKMESLAGHRQTNLITVPNFYGSRADSGINSLVEPGGVIRGLCEENFHGTDLIRSFVGGMAEELYELYRRIPANLREDKNQIVASGNGIRKNHLLREEIERRFGMKVNFSPYEEEAAAGAAMLASKYS